MLQGKIRQDEAEAKRQVEVVELKLVKMRAAQSVLQEKLQQRDETIEDMQERISNFTEEVKKLGARSRGPTQPVRSRAGQRVQRSNAAAASRKQSRD